MRCPPVPRRSRPRRPAVSRLPTAKLQTLPCLRTRGSIETIAVPAGIATSTLAGDLVFAVAVDSAIVLAIRKPDVIFLHELSGGGHVLLALRPPSAATMTRPRPSISFSAREWMNPRAVAPLPSTGRTGRLGGQWHHPARRFHPVRARNSDRRPSRRHCRGRRRDGGRRARTSPPGHGRRRR